MEMESRSVIRRLSHTQPELLSRLVIELQILFEDIATELDPLFELAKLNENTKIIKGLAGIKTKVQLGSQLVVEVNRPKTV